VGTLFTLFVLPCIYTLLAVEAGLPREEVVPE